LDQPSATPYTQKKGSINKCPSCGAAIGAFVSACEACGHEFTNIEANRTITALVKRFDEIEKEADEQGLKGNKRQQAILEKRARTIRDFPIPNSRDDLLELIEYIRPKIKDSVSPDPNINDWREKFNEVLNRAKNAYKNDTSTLAELDSIEKSLQTSVAENLQIKAKKNPLFVFLLAGIALLAIIGFLSSHISQSKLQKCQEKYSKGALVEKDRLERVLSSTDQSYKSKNYSEALTQAGKLHWEYKEDCNEEENGKAIALWNDKRTQMTELVKKSLELDAADKNADANRQATVKVAEQHKEAAIVRVKAEKEKAQLKAHVEQENAKASKAATEKRKAATEKEF
jgi:hypothetical protein